MTTLELIESAITSIEDGWTKSALDTLKEAQLQEKAREQLLNAGVAPESMKYLVDALKELTHSLEDEVLVHDDQRSAMQKARAAIAKATGDKK